MEMVSSILPETVHDDDIFSLMKQTNEKAKEKKKKWWNSDPKFYAAVQESISQWFINQNLEFESSFGIKKKENFVYGVDRSLFVLLLNKITEDESWECLSKEWKKIEEINFDKNVRLVHNIGERDHWIPEWKATMKIQNGSLEGSAIDIRFNLNIELQSQALRFSRATNYRFKRRKSFQKGILRIDFTCIKQGSSPQEALKSKTIYQAEVEWDKTKCSSLKEAKDTLPVFFELLDRFLTLGQSKGGKASEHNFVSKAHKVERSLSVPAGPSKKKTKKDQQLTSAIPKKTPDEEMREWGNKFQLPNMNQEPLALPDSTNKTAEDGQEEMAFLGKLSSSAVGPKKRGRKPIDPKTKTANSALKSKGKNKWSAFEFSPLKESFTSDNSNSINATESQNAEAPSSTVSENPFAQTLGSFHPFGSAIEDLSGINPFE